MATRGRPTKHTSDLAETICRRIAEGEPLTKICRDAAMPEYSTVLGWRCSDKEFSEMYARAREDSADTLVDQILEIADDASADWTTDKDDKRVVNHEHVQRARLRVDARKWAASKMKPRTYGEKEAPLSVKLPSVNGASGLPGAQLKIIEAVTSGELTLSEARTLSALYDDYRRCFESAELEGRIEALEARSNA